MQGLGAAVILIGGGLENGQTVQREETSADSNRYISTILQLFSPTWVIFFYLFSLLLRLKKILIF